jgi:hypothetical protein
VSLRHPGESTFPGRGLVPRESPAIETEARALLARFRGEGLTSGSILEELSNIGHDSAWFAREIARLMQQVVDPTLQIRLLELVHSIIKQKEGSKLQVSEVDNMSDSDLEAIVTGMLKDAKAGGLDLDSFVAAVGGKVVDVEVVKGSTSSRRASPKKKRGRKSLQSPQGGPEVPQVKKANPSPKRRKQERKNNRRRRRG